MFDFFKRPCIQKPIFSKKKKNFFPYSWAIIFGVDAGGGKKETKLSF